MSSASNGGIVLHEDVGFGWITETPLGRFKAVHSGPLPDNFVFECPGCGAWAYLDLDQWHGRVSVDHTDTGCTYHETHDYAQALIDEAKERIVSNRGNKLEQRACAEAGCHDFTDPVIVRQGWHLLHPSTEVAVSFCRRCGATLSLGWTEEASHHEL